MHCCTVYWGFTMAISKVDDLSSDERKLVVKALLLLAASEKRAMKASDGDFVALYERELARIEALSLKFR